MISLRPVSVLAAEGSPPELASVRWVYEVRVGSGVPLQVNASGTAPLFYQWQRDGADIPGATNTTYVFTPAHCKDSASIGVTITNEFGNYSMSPRLVRAFGCLQPLIDAAAPGETITLPPTNFDDNIVIDKDLVLQGTGPEYTTIDGGYRGNVVVIRTNANVTLRRLRFQHMNILASGRAGGVINMGTLMLGDCLITGYIETALNNAGTMIVSNTSIVECGGQNLVAIDNFSRMSLFNTLIQRNRAYDDGGTTMIENQGTMMFNDCDISDNTGKPFSSSCIWNSAVMLMTNVVVANNRSGTGAGISSFGNMILSRCTIRGNRSSYYGSPGVIENYGTILVEKSAIRDNSGGNGSPGGLANYGLLTMIASEISGNSSYYYPIFPEQSSGGLFNTSTGTLINCTISSNIALGSLGYGGGIGNRGWLALTNCTITGNQSLVAGGIYNQGSLALVGTIVARNKAATNQPPGYCRFI
jgi:hypothetical protein